MFGNQKEMIARRKTGIHKNRPIKSIEQIIKETLPDVPEQDESNSVIDESAEHAASKGEEDFTAITSKNDKREEKKKFHPQMLHTTGPRLKTTSSPSESQWSSHAVKSE